MESEKFITVLTFTFPYESAIIRGRLESEGIVCFVKDELTAQVNPFYSNAIGGVKLQVRESDLDRTIEILKEAGYIKEGESQLSQGSPHESPRPKKYAGKMICPVCGSQEVVKSRKAGWPFLITSLLFWFPTPIFQRTYYCFDCKREFKLKRK